LGYYIIPFGIIYADNQLITIFAGDVRVAPVNVGNSTYWKYEYSMKDHTSTPLSASLGNTRVVFAAHSHGQPELLQQTSYYPFGMILNQQSYYSQNATENKYLYNSKELQDDQLAGNTLDWYDYGARFYDATLGRWHVVDLLAEKYYSISTYAYVANNPILYIDPDGQEIKIYYRDQNDKIQKFQFNGTNAKNAPSNSFVKNTIAAYNYNVNNGGGKNLQYAATNNDGIDIKIVQTSERNAFGPAETTYGKQKAVEMFVFFNPDRGKITSDGIETSPATALEHEADHAVLAERDMPAYLENKSKKSDKPFPDYEEERVGTGSESETAVANGEAPKGWVRPEYGNTTPVIKEDWKYKNENK
jgi:RHS repeat-associated protein